jgi:hypothetical protein
MGQCTSLANQNGAQGAVSGQCTVKLGFGKYWQKLSATIVPSGLDSVVNRHTTVRVMVLAGNPHGVGQS